MEDIGISHEMRDIVIIVQITMVHSRTSTTNNINTLKKRGIISG